MVAELRNLKQIIESLNQVKLDSLSFFLQIILFS